MTPPDPPAHGVSAAVDVRSARGEPPDPVLAVTIAGVAFRNPVILAAGTHGTLDEFADVCPLERVGGLVAKSITPLAREGNATWRVVPSRAGMLNAIGLANPGIEAFVREVAPRACRTPTTVIASAAGFSIDDYVRVVAELDAFARPGVASIPAIELNVSCPNVKTGTEFGHTPGLLGELMRAVRPAAAHAKLFVKLSPLTPDIVGVAEAAVRGGADALVLCNTVPALAIDVRSRRPRLANVTGGYSGPGVHPLVTRLIHVVYRAVGGAPGDGRGGVPIIGVGGVTSWEDAAEFILAGASAVGVGTVLFADPRAPVRIARGLRGWVRDQGAGSIGALVGGLRV